MPKQDYTHIQFVLDRSGSMNSLKDTVIEGFNKFLSANQDMPGKLTTSICLFDHQQQTLCHMAPGEDTPFLDSKTFVPRGTTALIDACVDNIDSLGDDLLAMDEEERPDKVIFVVYTDGLENASQYHSATELEARIKQQEDKYKWEFVYLGAHPDAFGEGTQLGFDVSKIGGYAHSNDGMAQGFGEVLHSVSLYRSNQADGVYMNHNKKEETTTF